MAWRAPSGRVAAHEGIRPGHGIIQLTTNHEARVAERVSTLDLLSNGSVERGVADAVSNTGGFADR